MTDDRINSLERGHDDLKASISIVAESTQENTKGIKHLTDLVNDQGERLIVFNTRQDNNEKSITKIFDILDEHFKDDKEFRKEHSESNKAILLEMQSMNKGINAVRIDLERMPLNFVKEMSENDKEIYKRVNKTDDDLAKFKESVAKEYPTTGSLYKQIAAVWVLITVIGFSAVYNFNSFKANIKSEVTTHKGNDIQRHRDLTEKLDKHIEDENLRYTALLRDHSKLGAHQP